MTPFERAEVERELSAFDIALGANERITRQAIPMAYTRCARRQLLACALAIVMCVFALCGVTSHLTSRTRWCQQLRYVLCTSCGVNHQQPGSERKYVLEVWCVWLPSRRLLTTSPSYVQAHLPLHHLLPDIFAFRPLVLHGLVDDLCHGGPHLSGE